MSDEPWYVDRYKTGEDPRVEMEVTVTFKYKTDPYNYDEDNPVRPSLERMAEMDQELFNGDSGELFVTMESEDLTITVKPAKND